MLLMLCLLVFQSGQEKFSTSAAIKHSVEVSSCASTAAAGANSNTV